MWCGILGKLPASAKPRATVAWSINSVPIRPTRGPWTGSRPLTPKALSTPVAPSITQQSQVLQKSNKTNTMEISHFFSRRFLVIVTKFHNFCKYLFTASTTGQCNSRLSSQFSRYCGSYLGLTALGLFNQPICGMLVLVLGTKTCYLCKNLI